MKEEIVRILNSLDYEKNERKDLLYVVEILNSLMALYPAGDHDCKLTMNYNLFRLVSIGAAIRNDCHSLVCDYFYWEMYKNTSEMYNYDYIYPYIWEYCNYSDDLIMSLIHEFPDLYKLYQGDNQTILSLGVLMI